MHNIATTPTTPTHATLTTIPTTTINTTTTTTPITSIATINTTTTNSTTAITTTTTTQTQIPSLMDLDISLPPRLRTPSLPLTIPLESSPHTPSSFPERCRSFSNWGSGELSYQTCNRDPRKSPSLGDSEDLSNRIKTK